MATDSEYKHLAYDAFGVLARCLRPFVEECYQAKNPAGWRRDLGIELPPGVGLGQARPASLDDPDLLLTILTEDKFDPVTRRSYGAWPDVIRPHLEARGATAGRRKGDTRKHTDRVLVLARDLHEMRNRVAHHGAVGASDALWTIQLVTRLCEALEIGDAEGAATLERLEARLIQVSDPSPASVPAPAAPLAEADEVAAPVEVIEPAVLVEPPDLDGQRLHHALETASRFEFVELSALAEGRDQVLVPLDSLYIPLALARTEGNPGPAAAPRAPKPDQDTYDLDSLPFDDGPIESGDTPSDEPTGRRPTGYLPLIESTTSLLLGEAGAGKSTTLRRLARSLALAAFASEGAPPRTAVYLEAPKVAAAGDLARPGQLLDAIAATYPADAEAILADIRRGSAVILVDGCDELGDSRARSLLGDALAALAANHEGVRVVAASRPDAVPDLGAAGSFPRWHLGPLDDASRTALSLRLFPGMDAHDEGEALAAVLRARADAGHLATTPLVTARLAMLWRAGRALPESRIGIVDAVLRLHLELWPRTHGRGSLAAESVFEDLAPLANLALSSPSGDVSRGDALRAIERTVGGPGKGREAREAAAALVRDMGEVAGILRPGDAAGGEPTVRFAYRDFAEYIAAYALVAEWDRGNVPMARLVRRGDWHDRWLDFLLVAGEAGTDRASRAVRELIAADWPAGTSLRRNSIRAGAALLAGLRVDAELRRELVARLARAACDGASSTTRASARETLLRLVRTDADRRTVDDAMADWTGDAVVELRTAVLLAQFDTAGLETLPRVVAALCAPGIGPTAAEGALDALGWREGAEPLLNPERLGPRRNTFLLDQRVPELRRIGAGVVDALVDLGIRFLSPDPASCQQSREASTPLWLVDFGEWATADPTAVLDTYEASDYSETVETIVEACLWTDAAIDLAMTRALSAPPDRRRRWLSFVARRLVIPRERTFGASTTFDTDFRRPADGPWRPWREGRGAGAMEPFPPSWLARLHEFWTEATQADKVRVLETMGRCSGLEAGWHDGIRSRLDAGIDDPNIPIGLSGYTDPRQSTVWSWALDDADPAARAVAISAAEDCSVAEPWNEQAAGLADADPDPDVRAAARRRFLPRRTPAIPLTLLGADGVARAPLSASFRIEDCGRIEDLLKRLVAMDAPSADDRARQLARDAVVEILRWPHLPWGAEYDGAFFLVDRAMEMTEEEQDAPSSAVRWPRPLDLGPHDELRDAIWSLLDGATPMNRFWITAVWATLERPASVPHLIRLFDDPDWLVRRHAYKVMTREELGSAAWLKRGLRVPLAHGREEELRVFADHLRVSATIEQTAAVASVVEKLRDGRPQYRGADYLLDLLVP